MSDEIEYRDVPSLPGIVAGSDGSMWVRLGDELAPAPTYESDGYPHIRIAGRNWRVHRLVLEAFKGPPPSKEHVGRHLDDVRSNNHISNLEWGTRSDNRRDAFRNGRHPPARATRAVCCRLPEMLVVRLEEQAELERRTVTNLIETILSHALDCA